VEEYRDLDATEQADILEIQDVFARYTHVLDTKDIGGFLDLFTDGCRYVVHGRTYEGRQGVADMVSLAEPNGVHLTASPVIRLAGDSATSRQSFFAIHADRKTMRIGWYEDELARQDGRWRISVRRVTFVRSDGSLRPPL
jgi:uncharacterized protein (TIGR02246 family)